jgi:hypothetical protein
MLTKITGPRINKDQIRAVKTLQRLHGIEDGDYRKILIERFNTDSCTKLSMRQARNLIDYLKGKSCWTCAPRPKREKLDASVTLLANPGQLHIIEDLRQAHSWAWHPHKYRAWIKNRFSEKWAAAGYPPDRIALSPQATDVIEALKAMIRAEKKCICRLAEKAQ